MAGMLATDTVTNHNQFVNEAYSLPNAIHYLLEFRPKKLQLFSTSGRVDQRLGLKMVRGEILSV